ncbi:MAG: hypothetical protein KJ070_19045 [Verrucomicrobia bacterium]|nr:hypothetical protein [Verrucomicrobiota bacterium]
MALDEALGLVESFSPALVRLGARAAAGEGYEPASADLVALAGIGVERRQIHRLVNAAGPQVAEQLKQNPNTDSQTSPILYVEADATGVPMVAKELAGCQGKQPDGSAKSREVKLGCVFTQTRTDPETGLPVRDLDSTTNRLLKKSFSSRKSCKNTNDFEGRFFKTCLFQQPANVGGFESAAEFGLCFRNEAGRRGLGRAAKVVFLGDGAAWIWELARIHFPLAILTVDLDRLLERLHQLCPELYAGQPSWAKRMEDQWKALLHQDRVADVIAAARRWLWDLGSQPDDTLEKEIAYFEHQQSRMPYQTYRKQGLFYGSGIIEAGCEVVIGQRLKESGVFWTQSGATSILAMRCALKSNR